MPGHESKVVGGGGRVERREEEGRREGGEVKKREEKEDKYRTKREGQRVEGEGGEGKGKEEEMQVGGNSDNQICWQDWRDRDERGGGVCVGGRRANRPTNSRREGWMKKWGGGMWET